MIFGMNKELLLIKSHFFLFTAATGAIVPFLSTISEHYGFTPLHIGYMYTLLPICGLIAKPLFGILADKYEIHKIIFITFKVIFTIAFFFIYFIPEIPYEKKADVIFTCDSAQAFIEVCSPDHFTDETLRSVFSSPITNASCHLSCLGTTKAYQQMCHGWNMSEFCSLANSTHAIDERFNINAHFNMKENLELANCVNLRVRNVTSDKSSVNHLLYCDSQLRPSCIMTCSTVPPINELLHEIQNKNENADTFKYQFYSFLSCALMGWIGMSVIVTIADAICMNSLASEGCEKEYGKQRMWGCIGFGIFSIATGHLVDILSLGNYHKDYTCVYFIILIVMIFDIISSSFLKQKSSCHTDLNFSILQEINTIAREGRVLVFAFWCIGTGMCTGLVWNFLMVYTENITPVDERKWIKTLQGLLTGMQCFLGELPFNYLSGWVLKKLGHINVMSLVLLMYAIRFMAYSLIMNPWYYLIIELLHGPTFGLIWPTMVAYADKVAPSGIRAAMQGIVGAIFEGIGTALGSLVGGFIMNEYKGATMFRIFSAGALIWLGIFWLLQLLLRKMKAYPINQGHSHLATYATPNDAILMTMSQELQTY